MGLKGRSPYAVNARNLMKFNRSDFNEFVKLRASRAFAPSRPTCFHAFTSSHFTHLTCLPALCAFALYVPYLRALSKRLARLICEP